MCCVPVVPVCVSETSLTCLWYTSLLVSVRFRVNLHSTESVSVMGIYLLLKSELVPVERVVLGPYPMMLG